MDVHADTRGGSEAELAGSPTLLGRELPRFETVYREHVDYVWRVLASLGVRPSELPDAAQEVFVVVHRRLPEFEARSSLRTWIYGIARRLASRQRRTEFRDTRRREAWAEHLQTSDLAGGQAERMQMLARIDELRRFVDELEPDLREVFECCELLELSTAEAGRALGLPSTTIKGRLQRARAEFRDLCREISGGEGSATETDVARLRGIGRPSAQQRHAGWLALLAALPPAAVPVDVDLGYETGSTGLGAAVASGSGSGLGGSMLGVVAGLGLGVGIVVATVASSSPSSLASAKEEVEATRPVAAAAHESRDSTSSRSVTTEPPAGAVVSSESETITSELQRDREAKPAPRRSRSRARGGAKAAADRAPSSHDLRAEVELLALMHRADARPRRVLELAARHRAEFSDPRLALEVELLATIARCRLGQAGRAPVGLDDRARRRFSGLVARMRRVCSRARAIVSG